MLPQRTDVEGKYTKYMHEVELEEERKRSQIHVLGAVKSDVGTNLKKRVRGPDKKRNKLAQTQQCPGVSGKNNGVKCGEGVGGCLNMPPSLT